MALYLIAFNDESGTRSHHGRAAGEGHDRQGPDRGDRRPPVYSSSATAAWTRRTSVCSVDPGSGAPLFTDGPYVETKEHLGGLRGRRGAR